MSDTDLELLALYTRQHAEDAFTEIVRRHLDLVHSAALRQVRSPQLAEEVAQSTFINLARHAHRLAPDTILTAWLYQVTRREAIDVVRREARRQLREEISSEMIAMNATTADWSHIEPLLDEAMHALDETDRAAVLLRYFENKSLREVGTTLGTSENAAQKRLCRAVERLREFFAKRGVSIAESGLVVVISANAVQAAPLGLIGTISAAAALVGTAVQTSTAIAATKTIAMTTLQKTLIGATLVVAVGTGMYEAHQASILRTQVQVLQQQQTPLADQIEQLSRERDDGEGKIAALRDANERLNRNTGELLRLRGEVNLLRRQQDDLLKQIPVKITSPPVKQNEVDATWLQQVLNSPPKDQGAAAGTLRGKLLRRDMTNISPSEVALRDALLQRQLNQLEHSPAEFADFQAAFIQGTLAIADGTRVQQMRDIIQGAYEQAVASGLDIPSKPTTDTESWVQRRFQLDRQATAQLKQVLTPEEQTLFDRAFLGVMGIDLGGVGVDKTNYPKGFLGPE